jgi:hypothetical protein
MTRPITRRSFGLGIAAALALRGATPEQQGKELVAKVIDGLGGDAFRNMQTRTEIGEAYSFYRNNITGLAVARIYVKYLPAGASIPKDGLRIVQREVFGKKQDDAVIFTKDGQAYDVTYRGAQPLADSKIKQFHDTNIQDVFYILRERMDEPGIGFESRGNDVIENQPVRILGIFDSQNRDVTVWVNSDTYLPVRQRYTRWDPIVNDRRIETTTFAKYRDVGNHVMWPYDVQRDRDGEKVYEMYATSVKVDEPLPDSMFELPAGMKILKKV